MYFCAGPKAQEDINGFLKDLITIFGAYILKNTKIRDTGKGLEISINNAYIARLFNALGVPKNDKVIQSFIVPKWIYADPKLEKEFFSSLIHVNYMVT